MGKCKTKVIQVGIFDTLRVSYIYFLSKNIFYDKMDLRAFLVWCDDLELQTNSEVYSDSWYIQNPWHIQN